uniref:Zinc finger, CCHC-type n=1 Tax=Tanacetum cinerariifolium TaxID=118510 RepID=A0A6L2JSU3_TANCI|nr:zinc finger, CCHC-type [Tanacetum cinerariifolium]
MPELMEDDTVEAIRRKAKWENDDCICKGHILNGMSDSLFDTYQNVESAKELWDSLESKYMAEDASSKKLLKCGKTGHFKRDCHCGKKNNAHASGSGKGSKEQSQDQDSGATTQVCKDRGWFKTYEPVKDRSVLYMGDDHFAPIHGKGSVSLEFSYGKTITLINVLYVPKLHKNLVSGSMLNKCGYKQVYEFDKYILSKSGVFVGFGYYNNGHVHYKRMLEMSKDDLIYVIEENPKNVLLESFMKLQLLTYNSKMVWLKGNRAFKEMGCRAVGRLSDRKRNTLGEKGIDCIFAGYDEHSKAYRFYVIEPNDSVFISSIIESRDAIFDEKRFSSIPRPKNFIPNLKESQRDDHYDDVPSETPEPRRDPRSYNEAMNSRDAAFWKEAIDDEIGSIMENNIWVLSDLPSGCKPLGCKWIFERKTKVDGAIDKFKARLVIQGFRQKEGINYFDTYAPVARITAIRLFTDQNQVDKTKKFLSSRFSMKDMREADVIFGIKIKRKNKGIVITQSHYIEKILKKFNRKDCSPVSNPIDLVEKLKPNTVGRLSRFTSNHSRQHWQAITRVLKYLKCTMNYGLSYVGYPSVLEAYSDASWINHVEDSSSTSGWVFLLRGCAISWASKKQTCITGSTMKLSL